MENNKDLFKNVAFLCPYFGKLPQEQIRLFIKSCKYNTDFNWFIITDDHTKFEVPSNVKFIYTTFDNLEKEIRKKFDFEIYIENPYKLCDFKPAYGYIFSDLIEGYKYWLIL